MNTWVHSACVFAVQRICDLGGVGRHTSAFFHWYLKFYHNDYDMFYLFPDKRQEQEPLFILGYLNSMFLVLNACKESLKRNQTLNCAPLPNGTSLTLRGGSRRTVSIAKLSNEKTIGLLEEFCYLVDWEHSHTNAYCNFLALGNYYFELVLCVFMKKNVHRVCVLYWLREVSDAAHARIARARSARTGIPLWLEPRQKLMVSPA